MWKAERERAIIITFLEQRPKKVMKFPLSKMTSFWLSTLCVMSSVMYCNNFKYLKPGRILIMSSLTVSKYLNQVQNLPMVLHTVSQPNSRSSGLEIFTTPPTLSALYSHPWFIILDRLVLLMVVVLWRRLVLRLCRSGCFWRFGVVLPFLLAGWNHRDMKHKCKLQSLCLNSWGKLSLLC